LSGDVHLAQLNIGRTLYPIEHPRMRGFVDRLDEINALAERTPGYIWRLQDDGGNATHIRVTDDPRVIVNLTVWESPEHLSAFTYHTAHMEVFRLRRGWFEPWPGPHLVLWWIPAGSLPTIAEALERLDRLAADGPGPDAFTMKQPFPPALRAQAG
jgi:heme-degrading monooxygenase HmoA